MNAITQEYMTKKQTLKYWILTDLTSISLPIIGMNSTQKQMTQAGIAITKKALAGK